MIKTAPLSIGEPDLFVLATDEDPIDDSDVCLAISKTLDRNRDSGYELNARIAQLGFQVSKTRLRIMNLQGSGPKQKLLRAGFDPKKTYDKVRKNTGLKPINSLLGVMAQYAQEHGLKTMEWKGSNSQFKLYPTVLKALQFREQGEHFLELDLQHTTRRKILSRVTGADPEKTKSFNVLYDTFEPLLDALPKLRISS